MKVWEGRLWQRAIDKRARRAAKRVRPLPPGWLERRNVIAEQRAKMSPGAPSFFARRGVVQKAPLPRLPHEQSRGEARVRISEEKRQQRIRQNGYDRAFARICRELRP